MSNLKFSQRFLDSIEAETSPCTRQHDNVSLTNQIIKRMLGGVSAAFSTPSNPYFWRCMAERPIDLNQIKIHGLQTVLAPILDSTISKLIGPFWKAKKNAYGSISGQDKVHDRAGLITIRQLFEFYTNKDGEIDFGHFETLKDVVNNCSMNSRKRNHWKPVEQQAERRTDRRIERNVGNTDRTSQLIQLVQSLNTTVATQQQQINAMQQQINMLLARR